MSQNIYVASSWRNEHQPVVVERLRSAGHEVYDFRHPEPGNDGFGWSQINPAWREWSPKAFVDALQHPAAVKGFGLDFGAMQECTACVLVMPCGRSAHLEAGWFIGQDKPTVILLTHDEPELMYKMAHKLTFDLEEVERWLALLPDEFDGVCESCGDPAARCDMWGIRLCVACYDEYVAEGREVVR